MSIVIPLMFSITLNLSVDFYEVEPHYESEDIIETQVSAELEWRF